MDASPEVANFLCQATKGLFNRIAVIKDLQHSAK